MAREDGRKAGGPPGTDPETGTVAGRKGIKKRIFGKRGGFLAYIPGESFIHRMNPLTKLAILIIFTGTALAFGKALPGLVLWSSVLAAAWLAGLIRPLFRGYLIIVPFIVFVVVTDAFFAGPEAGVVIVTWQAGFVTLKLVSGRVLFALAMGFRLLALSGVGILFISTTSYTAFVRALRSAGFPGGIAFSLGTAFRTMSVLAEDASKIMNAQRSRGMEFDRGLLTRNRNKLMTLTVPMAVIVLRRSRSLTAAMESRGFSSSARPTVYRRPGFSGADAAVVIAVAAVVAIAWYASLRT
ncbi:energy-coupling factor transport system permease protein [Methanolinea mesophila]|uniref:energy-coupling factor transporter transmembrane component T family protein n=1 Tax=Methanolinea mesophila TaxID=547055 RepID=UPI001AE92AEF|nr:energy-coupling factor transporter transmembrane component T [Methanolinea mesophila]MBP1928141.1 energy-coupling factor transport system permease protein [Methanolinea mesophila]